MRIAVRSELLAFQTDLLLLHALVAAFVEAETNILTVLRFSFLIPISWYPYNARYYWNYYRSAEH